MNTQNIFENRHLFTEERWQGELEFLKQQKRATFSELAKLFRVSESTIRRDLRELEKRNMIKRTHGGAILPEIVRLELSIEERTTKLHLEKERIGKFAAQYINSGETVFIDAGTTTLEVARNIKGKENLWIITNGVNISTLLSSIGQIRVVLTGGELYRPDLSMVGPTAEEAISKFHVDKVILGADAISVECGLTCANLQEAQVKKVMIKAGREIIIVADHSKIGKVAFTSVAPITQIHTLITDSKVPSKFIRDFERQGIQVFTVD